MLPPIWVIIRKVGSVRPACSKSLCNLDMTVSKSKDWCVGDSQAIRGPRIATEDSKVTGGQIISLIKGFQVRWMDFHGESTNRTAYWWEQQSYTFYKAMKAVPAFHYRPLISWKKTKPQLPISAFPGTRPWVDNGPEPPATTLLVSAQQPFWVRMVSPVLIHGPLSLLPALPRHEKKMYSSSLGIACKK